MPRRTHKLLLALLLTAIPAFSQPAPEPGISHALAQSRAARLSDLHYTLTFVLIPKAPTITATETLTFTDSGAPAGSPPDLPIEFRDGALAMATLNGAPIPTTLTNGHLILPAAALHPGPNTLVTSFTANIAPAGKAITRYLDKDDGNEYLYTLFVPMDADMAFPLLRPARPQSHLHPQDHHSCKLDRHCKLFRRPCIARGTERTWSRSPHVDLPRD